MGAGGGVLLVTYLTSLAPLLVALCPHAAPVFYPLADWCAQASETANYFTATPALIDFVRHTENDCFLALGVMFNLQMIPLSKQLTELSGNLWRRTLQGGRAERIEYGRLCAVCVCACARCVV